MKTCDPKHFRPIPHSHIHANMKKKIELLGKAFLKYIIHYPKIRMKTVPLCVQSSFIFRNILINHELNWQKIGFL